MLSYLILFFILYQLWIIIRYIIRRVAYQPHTFTHCPNCGARLPEHMPACTWKPSIKPKFPVGSAIVLFIFLILPILLGIYFDLTTSTTNRQPTPAPTITLNPASLTKNAYYANPPTSQPSSFIGCPKGCTVHPIGCDIKGNIAFDTGEKIYHLKGQEFYASTTIQTSLGERWFCTEAEAISNGWRKSSR